MSGNSNLRALELAREKQINISNDLSEQVNEMREKTGKAFDNDAYTSKMLEFTTSERQVKALDRQIEDAKGVTTGLSRTGVRQAFEASPTARFIRAAVEKGDGSQGLEAFEIEEQTALRASNAFRKIAKPTDLILPVRAVTTTTTAGAIATDTMTKLVKGLADFGGARKMSQRISTPSGNDLDVPKVDDSAGIGEQLGSEGSDAAAEAPASVGQTTLQAFTFSSKFVDISREAITDTESSGLDLIGYAMNQCVRRLGRITNARFTNGSGSSQPEGFMTRAKDGITTAASGGAANISYKDLVGMVYSIDACYLDGGEMGEGGNQGETGGVIGWQFHRNFEAIIMGLLDGDNRPLWAPGLSAIAGSARQNMLLGYPYALNYDMPNDMTGGSVKKVAAFGNFGYHVIRDVDAILVRVFDQDSTVGSRNEVRVLGFARSDSRYIGNGAAGANANEFKVLKAKA